MEEISLNQTNEQNVNDPKDESIKTSQTLPERKKRFYIEGSLYTFLSIFGIVFLCSLLVFQILLEPIKVVGKSMQPTINLSVLSETDENHCDIVYFSQDDYYQNGEIVIVSNETQNYVNRQSVQYLIKRVIACPTQTITFKFLREEQIDDGSYTNKYFYTISVADLNGNSVEVDNSCILEEMYFTDSEYLFSTSTYFQEIFFNIRNSLLSPDNRKYSITLSENTYFVMGDNRNNSEDSRYFGAVDYQDISGSVKLHVPYNSTLFEAIWLKIKSIF